MFRFQIGIVYYLLLDLVCAMAICPPSPSRPRVFREVGLILRGNNCVLTFLTDIVLDRTVCFVFTCICFLMYNVRVFDLLYSVDSTSAVNCMGSLVSEMTYTESSGTLSPYHSLTAICVG